MVAPSYVKSHARFASVTAKIAPLRFLHTDKTICGGSCLFRMESCVTVVGTPQFTSHSTGTRKNTMIKADAL